MVKSLTQIITKDEKSWTDKARRILSDLLPDKGLDFKDYSYEYDKQIYKGRKEDAFFKVELKYDAKNGRVTAKIIKKIYEDYIDEVEFPESHTIYVRGDEKTAGNYCLDLDQTNLERAFKKMPRIVKNDFFKHLTRFVKIQKYAKLTHKELEKILVKRKYLGALEPLELTFPEDKIIFEINTETSMDYEKFVTKYKLDCSVYNMNKENEAVKSSRSGYDCKEFLLYALEKFFSKKH